MYVVTLTRRLNVVVKYEPLPVARCKRLVAGFQADFEALQKRLARFTKEEPAKLLTSCDDVTRLCRVSTSSPQ